MLTIAASGSPFDAAFGLPLHPLAVHVPVVLLRQKSSGRTAYFCRSEPSPC